MKQIYIVITLTGTILSTIIKTATKSTYTHSSIALDKELKELYSFGRVNPYNAFKGGFVQEGINIGTFKRFKNTKTEIYVLDVSDEQYNKIKKIIKRFENKKENYKFNTLGLFAIGMNKKIKRSHRFYCAEFVRYILKRAKIDTTNLPDLIKPIDFLDLKNTKLVYKGYLREYKGEYIF